MNYPIKTTVWACCVSKIGPVCEHLKEDCEFTQVNPHEWYCTIHNVTKIAGTEEPVTCK